MVGLDLIDQTFARLQRGLTGFDCWGYDDLHQGGAVAQSLECYFSVMGVMGSVPTGLVGVSIMWPPETETLVSLFCLCVTEGKKSETKTGR